jgi:thioredoxin-dependent peroxiredoxin
MAGAPAIVYFYPKDDTSGCTAEACEFRDIMPKFTGARVLGVSPDPPKKHQKFIAKYGLNFTLLADPERQLIDPLGLWVEKTFYGKKYMGVARTTYLLDGEGRIVRVWEKVNPEGHAEEVLVALQSSIFNQQS